METHPMKRRDFLSAIPAALALPAPVVGHGAVQVKSGIAPLSGCGATAMASVSVGAITAIRVTEAGSDMWGYTTPPIILPTEPDGPPAIS
jgi:hypothetical protein